MKKKTRVERAKQQKLDHEKEKVIQQTLAFSKKRFKKFDEVIDGLYWNEDFSLFFQDKRIRKLHECFANLSSSKMMMRRKTFRNMLVFLYNNSLLVSGEENIQAIYNMVWFSNHWRRDFDNWKAVSKRGPDQLRELATHLFCQYKVPEFLHKCFFETKTTLHIEWFIHLGTGGKVREMHDIPIPFTQKAGHYFLQAPAEFSIAEALRWSQVRAMNGDEALARRVAYSWIGNKPYSDEDFWESFLLLAIRGEVYDHNDLGQLIDYVREMKRTNRDYSLKGRTVVSLRRQSEEWHERFSMVKNNFIWKPCGIDGYMAERSNDVIRIEELTDSKMLSLEGKNMKHCVSSYSTYCAQGRTAIFSLRQYIDGLWLDTMATFEVNLALRRVVQAKAKMNRPVSDEVKKHLEAWATKEQLEIGQYL